MVMDEAVLKPDRYGLKTGFIMYKLFNQEK